MKKQTIEIIELQFNLKLKLIDSLLETIGDYRKNGLNYKEIAEKMGVNPSVMTKLTKPDVKFIEGLKNKTITIRLNNLKSN